MESKNSMIIWMTLSTCLMLAITQHVDDAVNVESIRKSGGDSGSLGSRPSEKYMADLYNIMFDKEGHPRKGIATEADEISCFLPEISNSKSKISLTFDIREIKKNEQITNAYLIFPKESSESDLKPTGFARVDAADISDSATSPLNLNLGGWKSNDVTSKIKTWHKRRRKENTIHLDRKDHEYDVFSSGLDKTLKAPFLVVHSKSSIKQAKRNSYEAENIDVNPSTLNQGSHYKRGSNSQSCRREKMEIDTSILGWDKFIIAPKILRAFRCVGTCGPIFSTASKHQTWHSRVQALSAAIGIKQDGKRIEPPCCIPLEYETLYMLMIRNVDGKSLIKKEEITDLTVKSCGCF